MLLFLVLDCVLIQDGLHEIDQPCTNLFQKCSVDFRNVMYANSAVSRAGA